jgi:fructokinase
VNLWGIDLGGTKIEGVVLEPDSGEVVVRTRIPTEAGLGYDHILLQIEKLVKLLEQESGSNRSPLIGIGTPGAADPSSGLMKNCNTTALNGRRLPKDLADLLGVKLQLANDATCFALAEATRGAGRGADVVFGVILGTGVGGGVVVHGKVLGGAQGIAGEWGHNVLDPEGEPCYCGKTGCVETVLSGPALERFYHAQTGKRLPLAEIVGSNEPAAQQTVDRLVNGFGQALAVVVNIVDPDVVVLGGGVGNIPALYERGVEALAPWVFNDTVRTEIRKPMLGDSAGVFGAAMLAAER